MQLNLINFLAVNVLDFSYFNNFRFDSKNKKSGAFYSHQYIVVVQHLNLLTAAAHILAIKLAYIIFYLTYMKLVEPRRLVRQTNKGRPNRVKKGINEKKYLPIFIHIIIP